MTSRYDGADELVHVCGDGTVVTYVGFRTLPPATEHDGEGVAVVQAGERHRPDLLANRALGNALLAYRLADANDAMHPIAMCDRVGRPVRIPAPRL